jgi:hypothetical protein
VEFERFDDRCNLFHLSLARLLQTGAVTDIRLHLKT